MHIYSPVCGYYLILLVLFTAPAVVEPTPAVPAVVEAVPAAPAVPVVPTVADEALEVRWVQLDLEEELRILFFPAVASLIHHRRPRQPQYPNGEIPPNLLADYRRKEAVFKSLTRDKLKRAGLLGRLPVWSYYRLPTDPPGEPDYCLPFLGPNNPLVAAAQAIVMGK